MAWKEDGYRVSTERPANRPEGGLPPDLFSKPFICPCFSVRNFLQGKPDLFIEFCTFSEIYPLRKFLSAIFKILFKFLFYERRYVTLSKYLSRFFKIYPSEYLACKYKIQCTYGTFNSVVERLSIERPLLFHPAILALLHRVLIPG